MRLHCTVTMCQQNRFESKGESGTSAACGLQLDSPFGQVQVDESIHMEQYLLVTAGMREHGAKWPLFLFFERFSALQKNIVTQGGICVYFLKSARKGCFGEVGSWGGGRLYF